MIQLYATPAALAAAILFGVVLGMILGAALDHWRKRRLLDELRRMTEVRIDISKADADRLYRLAEARGVFTGRVPGDDQTCHVRRL